MKKQKNTQKKISKQPKYSPKPAKKRPLAFDVLAGSDPEAEPEPSPSIRPATPSPSPEP